MLVIVIIYLPYRGWIAIINDNLIGNCLSLVILSLALVMGLIGFLVSLVWGPSIASSIGSDPTTVCWLLTILAAVIGTIVSQIFVNVLDSAVAMVFVCYAESPDTLKVQLLSVISCRTLGR
jgi:hypothetical protein